MHQDASWLECLEPALSEDICRDLALSHALQGGQTGHQIAKLIRANDLRGVCEFSLDLNKPGWDIQELRECRQALAFFTKNEDLVLPGVDKVEAARKKFEEAEALCRETNRLFRLRSAGGFQFPPAVEGQLLLAQRLISRVLGDVPSLNRLGLRFGKGATTTVPKRRASVREKLDAELSCSSELAVWLKPILSELPTLCGAHSKPRLRFNGEWSYADYVASAASGVTQLGDCEVCFNVPVRIVPGKLNYAVKNALVYRTTLAEPTLNGMVQMAVGDEMVSRLSRSGLNLKDQSINQRLALLGSKNGDLATLDLSSASDTIATLLVADLLPLDWFLFLSRCRTGTIEVDGVTRRLEMFSSMGNGFTFPLESLIFWALAVAVCGGTDNVSIYGDDIICPSEHADAVKRLLRCVGFVPNEKKSYTAGPFRESCGADYYHGEPVRPFFVRNTLNGAGLFLLHNNYIRAGDVDRAAYVESKIPIKMRRYGPDGFGDGHMIREGQTGLPEKLRAKGYSGKAFFTYVVTPKWDMRVLSPQSDYAYATYSNYRRPSGPGFGRFLQRNAIIDRIVAAVQRPERGTQTPEPSPVRGPFWAMFLRGHGTVSDVVALKTVRVTPVTLEEEIGGYLRMALDGASFEEAFGSFETVDVVGSTLPIADKPSTYKETLVYTL